MYPVKLPVVLAVLVFNLLSECLLLPCTRKFCDFHFSRMSEERFSCFFFLALIFLMVVIPWALIAWIVVSVVIEVPLPFKKLLKWQPLPSLLILVFLCKLIIRLMVFISNLFFRTPLGIGPFSSLSPIKKIRDGLFLYFNVAKRLNFSNLSSSER